MELSVHRIRFIEWSPSAITCLAFPPTLPPSRKAEKAPFRHPQPYYGILAVGRGNGNIELYEWSGAPGKEYSAPAWVLTKILPAPLRAKVESIAFAVKQPFRFSPNNPPKQHDLRLFSSGGGTDVVEWDMQSGTILRSHPAHGGSIWSLAVNPASTLLACACDDGSVRILSLDDDRLSHFRVMSSSTGKVLSVAWGPPVLRRKEATEGSDESEDETDEEWIDEWLVSGGSDAYVKRWEVKSGRVLASMRSDRVRSSRTLIWSVAVLSDGTVISGDSMGLVKFWDIRTSTQIKSVKAHDADVLCLAVNTDGSSVFSSGVDQNVAQCTLVKTTSEHGFTQKEWTMTSSRRLHSHDVRSMVVWPPHSLFPHSDSLKNRINPGISPLLISGGQDMVAVITPCATVLGAQGAAQKTVNPLASNPKMAINRVSVFSESIQQRIPYPLKGAVTVAKQARLVLCRRATGVWVWKLDSLTSGEPSGFDLVLQMDLNVSTHLVATAISDDGKWLAASDALEMKLFSLPDKLSANSNERPSRVKNIASVILKALEGSSSGAPSAAASRLSFTPDSSRLVIVCSPSSHIILLDLASVGAGQDGVLRVFSQHSGSSHSGRIIKPLPRMPDSDNSDDDAGRHDDDDAGRHDDDDASDFPNKAPLVTALTISGDGQWMASADQAGRCHVFNLDTLQHHCTLPSFELPIRELIFDPGNPQILVLAQVNNTLHVFDVEARTTPVWAKPVCENLPERFTGLRPGLEGLLFLPAALPSDDGSRSHYLVAWGTNWLCKINLGGRLTKADKWRRPRSTTKAAVNDDEAEEENFKLSTAYRQMLFCAHLGANEIVVVERPILDLLTSDGVPPPFHKHRYGT